MHYKNPTRIHMQLPQARTPFLLLKYTFYSALPISPSPITHLQIAIRNHDHDRETKKKALTMGSTRGSDVTKVWG